MKDRVYIETTIVSYLAARLSRDLIVAAHQQLTEEWWVQRRPSFDLFTSQVVVREASAGDREMAQRRLDFLTEIPLLAIDESALQLATQLLQRGMIPARAAEDVSHIAIAAVHGMDYLLTWNCKHIANAQMQKTVAEICRAAGYEPSHRECQPFPGGSWPWHRFQPSPPHHPPKIWRSAKSLAGA